MVKKLLTRAFGRVEGLHNVAYLLAALTFVSQVLALVRDRMLASHFGASATLDLYYASFRIPDLIFVAISSIVSIFVLIPFLTDRVSQGREAAKRFLSDVMSVFIYTIAATCFITYLLMPRLAAIFFPGLADLELLDELVSLARIVLLSPMLLGLSNLFMSVTQYEKRFFIYAASPILYNVGIICGIAFLYPIFGIAGLAYGVVLGALLHLLVQVPSLINSGFAPRLLLTPTLQAFRDVAVTSIPRTLALTIQQFTLLIIAGIASFFSEGSIAIFNLSFNLQNVPLAIIGASYSVAAFPTLAQFIVNGERRQFLQHVLEAARHIIFWSIPTLVLFIVLRAQIVRTILGSGAFDWHDTRLTAASLALFAISLSAQSLILLFVRGYYAAGKNLKPLAVSIASALITLVAVFYLKSLLETKQTFAYFIETLFRVEGVHGIDVLVLPLSYSFGMLSGGLIFVVLFTRDFGSSVLGQLASTALHSFSASVIGGFVAYLLLNALDNVFNLETLKGIFLQGLLAGIGGLLAWMATLWILKNNEFAETRRTLSNKIFGVEAVPLEAQEL